MSLAVVIGVFVEHELLKRFNDIVTVFVKLGSYADDILRYLRSVPYKVYITYLISSGCTEGLSALTLPTTALHFFNYSSKYSEVKSLY